LIQSQAKAVDVSQPNLPLALLDRLLGSDIVPLEAKRSAIESWRRELADASVAETVLDALSSRLAHAETYLRQISLTPAPRDA